jgi:hydroxymethylbilane synthase
MGDRITADLIPPTLFHAVSQGALVVEIRADDQETQALCQMLIHQETQWKCLAKRALLRELEVGAVFLLAFTRHYRRSIEAECNQRAQPSQ